MDTVIKARVPKSLKDEVESVARDLAMSSADVIRQALMEYTARHRAERLDEPKKKGGRSK